MSTFLERVVKGWQKEDDWPPKRVKKHWDVIEQYRVRYRNDKVEMLQNNPDISISNHRAEVYTPVPWPRELCKFSAGLLFPDTPRVTLTASKEAVERIIAVNDFGAFAIKGGVKAARDGRIGIRIIRDPEIDEQVPLLTLVDENHILWDIRHDAFYMGGVVVIERPDEDDSAKVWRLLEEHSKGLVTRRLFFGGHRNLGRERPLTAHREFASLPPTEETGLDRATLVPWENVPGSESDLFGLGPIFDELNDAESMLLDRAHKSAPQVFVDRSIVDESGRLDLEGYHLTGGSRMRLPLGVSPTSTIEVVQPNFLSKEHVLWVDHIQQLMVTCAGYAPMTWGIQGTTANVTRAVSGYALKLAQLRTLLTRSAKEHMALQALGWAMATAIAWQSSEAKVSDFFPTIELGDGLPPDPLDGAQEVLYLSQALAASTETLVQTVHPTWTPEEVDSEVEAIMEARAFPAVGGAPLPSSVAGLGMRRARAEDPAMRAGAGVDPTEDIGEQMP